MKANTTLIFALISGVAASALGFRYLANKAAPPAEVSVLIAARDLASGETIRKTDLAQMKIPRDQFASLARQAYGVDDIDELLNREVHRPVSAGSYITRADTTPIVDLIISPTMVALGVTVSGANSLSQHLIQPGDNIDVYVLREERSTASPSTPPRTDRGAADVSQLLAQMTSESTVTPTLVLRSVRVLAVGTRLSGSRHQLQLEAEGPSHTPASNDLTVEVTRPQLEAYLKEWAGRFKVVVDLLPREEHLSPRNP